MDRRTAESVLLAVLAVVALAAAAATLPSADPSGGGGGDGSWSTTRGDGDDVARPTPAPNVGAGPDLSFLRPVVVALVVVGLLGLLVYLARYRREGFQLLVGLVAVVTVVAVVFWLVPFEYQPPPGGYGFGGLPLDQPTGGDGEGSPTPPPILLLAVVAVVAIGATLLRLRWSRTDDDGSSEDPSTAEEVAALGRAAGRAADRIESADELDNEVFRAWREMTALLDVDRPASTSPGEFAAAATRAGMDRDDVDELTRLFEDVRYGEDEPTEVNERRALSILRRVEETYVPGDGSAG